MDNPATHANLVSPEWYIELRYKIQEATENAKRLISEIDKEYSGCFGLQYGGLIEKYQCEDADLIM